MSITIPEGLTLIIDTDDYAGNYEREMFAFMTGCSDSPGENMHPMCKLFAEGRDSTEFDELLDVRLDDPGDDGFNRRHITIVPTPGLIKNGHPVYNSVAIFLTRRPKADPIHRRVFGARKAK